MIENPDNYHPDFRTSGVKRIIITVHVEACPALYIVQFKLIKSMY